MELAKIVQNMKEVKIMGRSAEQTSVIKTQSFWKMVHASNVHHFRNKLQMEDFVVLSIVVKERCCWKLDLVLSVHPMNELKVMARSVVRTNAPADKSF